MTNNQLWKEYFVLMKPRELHGTIKPNNKGYGYDTLFLSNFQGKLLKKEYTTFSQNVRCTFQVDEDMIIYIHHKYLEKIKSKLEIGKLYDIKIRDEKPHLINVLVYYDRWDMYIPIDSELEGISKTNDRFMVYLYDPQTKTAKSYGNFHKLEDALLFRDYCKLRKWKKCLQTNPHIGLRRSRSLMNIFKHASDKGDLFNKLDVYFGLIKPKKYMKNAPCTLNSVRVEKDLFDLAFEGLSVIEQGISKGIVSRSTSLDEYMNTIRAIHIAKNV